MPSDPHTSSVGRARFSEQAFDGVKVFTATMVQERERLGDRITEWVAEHPEFQVTEIVVTQSSDEAFHCLSFTVFYAGTSG